MLVPDVNRSRPNSPSIAPATRRRSPTGSRQFATSVRRSSASSSLSAKRTGRSRISTTSPTGSDQQALNKKAVESLIRAGAFDSFGHPRKGLLMVHEGAISQALQRRHEEGLGIQSLFGDSSPSAVDGPDWTPGSAPEIPAVEFERHDRLAYEKEMLGLYVSDHPMIGLEHALGSVTDTSIADIRELADAGEALTATSPQGEIRTTGGVVTELVHKRTKRGDLMANFVLEDLGSAIEVVVFPKEFNEYGPLLVEDTVVTVKGRIEVRDERIQLICVEIRMPELVPGEDPEVRIELTNGGRRRPDGPRTLEAGSAAHPGRTPVVIVIGDGERVLRLPPAFSVSTRKALLRDLDQVLKGADAA